MRHRLQSLSRVLGVHQTRSFVLARAGAVLLMAGLALAIPGVGIHRSLVAGLATGLAVPLILLIERFAPRERVDLYHVVFDALAVSVVVPLLPNAWHAGLVVLAVTLIASASAVGASAFCLIAIAASGWLAAVGFARDVANWQPPFLVFAALIPMVTIAIRNRHGREGSASSHIGDLVESSAAVFWESDLATGDVRNVTGSVEAITGWNPEAWRDAKHRQWIHPDDRKPTWLHANNTEIGGETQVRKFRTRHRDGHYIWLRDHVRCVDNGRGEGLLRGAFFDISELEAANERLEERARRDALTSLANRVAFLDDLDRRLADGEALALYILDLDRFKELNDTLGHPAGDEALRQIAHRLVHAAGTEALVARLGGDEFAVTRPIADHAALMQTAEQLLTACREPVELDSMPFSVDASVGVAIAPEHGTRSGELMRRADIAMYVAKHAEGGAHYFVPEDETAVVDRVQLAQNIQQALGTRQLGLWFQPKFDLASHRIVGAEGLLRWQHPDRGVLLPASFLDLLNVSKHQKELLDLILERGITMAGRCAEVGQPIQIAVNLSALSLHQRDLAERVDKLLRLHDLTPDLFALEITESDWMEDSPEARAVIHELAELGLTLSMDDFGTGYSSFQRLCELPIREVKIDRSLTTRCDDRESRERIVVGSLISLARDMGFAVVAEGVETSKQVEVLKEMGCDTAQGFAFGRASRPEAFLRYLVVSNSGASDRNLAENA